ncbi:MAG: TraM recognition domain-containing protein, partial [Janthinobacterium lividum]
RNMMAQTLGVSLEGDYDEIVANKPGMSPTPFPVVLDEIGYYAVSGMDKMLAMGRGLGFMFYLGFQELPGLKARIGESMYSLLGNATLQILMKLQEGSETRKYVEDTAGQIEVTQQTSYNATDGGGYRDAQHAEVRRVSRVDWKDLKGLIEGEAVVLFGNRRVYAKLFYAKLDVRGGRLRLNRPAVLRPPALDAIGRMTARTASIRALIEGGGAQASPSQVDTGPVLAAIVEGFRREKEAGKSLADCVRASIMAAGMPAAASTPPAQVSTSGHHLASGSLPDAPDSDYDAMLESVGRLPVVETDTAQILPPSAGDLDLLGMLTAIEEHSGQFRAQARARGMQVLAERDAALAPLSPELSPMSPEVLGRVIQTMILELSPPAVLVQAAE